MIKEKTTTKTKKVAGPKKPPRVVRTKVAEKKAPPVIVEESQELQESLKNLTAEFKTDRYFEAMGRRKTAIARARLFTKGEKVFLINQKPLEKYFPTEELQQTAISSLSRMKCLEKFRVEALVRGGGLHAQAEALRHATARALVLFNNDFRKRLRRVGFLTRDPRMRERKKFGLKRARRAPQWAKR